MFLRKENKMNFEEWLKFGVDNNFVSNQFCNTHDGYPMHDTKERAWEEGGDPCAHMVRLGSLEDWKLTDDWFGN
jgi:hypothetical protein